MNCTDQMRIPWTAKRVLLLVAAVDIFSMTDSAWFLVLIMLILTLVFYIEPISC